jgi:DNA-binding transcriptional regulator YdaS (Cro superfamily)
MDLRTFLRTLTREQRLAFARAIGTTLGHLNNMACGQAAVSALYAAQIELHSGAKVTRASLRPQDAKLIWPSTLPGIAA